MYTEFEKLLEEEFEEFVDMFQGDTPNMENIEKMLISEELTFCSESAYTEDFKDRFMSELPYHLNSDNPKELTLNEADLRTAWIMAIRHTKWYKDNKPKRDKTVETPALYITKLEVHKEVTKGDRVVGGEHIANLVMVDDTWNVELIETLINSSDLQIVVNALKYAEATGMERNHLND